MSNYEEEIQEIVKKGKNLPEKVDISILKYLWQAGPLGSDRIDNIPKFLRKIEALRNFDDNELRIFSGYLHLRSFNNQEVIFRQNAPGVGFYIVFSGHVDILFKDGRSLESSEMEVEIPKEDTKPVGDVNSEEKRVISLERGDFLGELALLQENSIRSASAVARNSCKLLGIFRPDLEELMYNHPVVATKLLQSVSQIIANRLHSITTEVGYLRYKLSQLEESVEKSI